MRTQGTHYPFTLIVKVPEKWLSSTCGKSDKNNLRIISKPHAYLQTMYKTPVKFQKNRYKTVGGVAHTRYPLSIHFDILRGTRNLSFVLRRPLLRTFETIWILVMTLECSNITASKSIRRERKMRPMELSGVNFSTHGSESECSCFDQVLCIRV